MVTRSQSKSNEQPVVEERMEGGEYTEEEKTEKKITLFYCHHCRHGFVAGLQKWCITCKKNYCFGCLKRYYPSYLDEPTDKTDKEGWPCPHCQKECREKTCVEVASARQKKIEASARKKKKKGKQIESSEERFNVVLHQNTLLLEQNHILLNRLDECRTSSSSDFCQRDDAGLERSSLMHKADICRLQEKLEELEEEKRKLEATYMEEVLELKSKLDEAEMWRKELHNQVMDLKGKIRVYCRVRPLLSTDDDDSVESRISYPTSALFAGRGIEINGREGSKHCFTLDQVFDSTASQEDVFKEVTEFIQSSVDGKNVCIFAYGQTGSGKSYTMLGRPDAPGLIPRSMEQIFERCEALGIQGWKYRMQACMLEVYNEKIKDLLGSEQGRNLEIEYQDKILKIPGLTILDVGSAEQGLKLLQEASNNRSIAPTSMNMHSSRSHFVFVLKIDGVNEGMGQKVQGILNLVDLAGSERLSSSEVVVGERIKETQNINKSLSAVGDVIEALSKKREHIPFRNSKLTRILEPCLRGEGKTMMIVTVSSVASSVNESLCSLRFAARVNGCEIGVKRKRQGNANGAHAPSPTSRTPMPKMSSTQDVCHTSEMRGGSSRAGTTTTAQAQPPSPAPRKANASCQAGPLFRTPRPNMSSEMRGGSSRAGTTTTTTAQAQPPSPAPRKEANASCQAGPLFRTPRPKMPEIRATNARGRERSTSSSSCTNSIKRDGAWQVIGTSAAASG